MLKVYLDTCCLNRPFDDQMQDRIRLEAEAVLAVLSRIENGEWTWVGSEVLLDEIEQTPDALKWSRTKLLSRYIHQMIGIGYREGERARALQQEGFQVFDALHLACAESAQADVFLTTDDRLLKLTKRKSKQLHVRVKNPLTWVEEMLK